MELGWAETSPRLRSRLPNLNLLPAELLPTPLPWLTAGLVLLSIAGEAASTQDANSYLQRLRESGLFTALEMNIAQQPEPTPVPTTAVATPPAAPTAVPPPVATPLPPTPPPTARPSGPSGGPP